MRKCDKPYSGYHFTKLKGGSQCYYLSRNLLRLHPEVTASVSEALLLTHLPLIDSPKHHPHFLTSAISEAPAGVQPSSACPLHSLLQLTQPSRGSQDTLPSGELTV